MSIESCDEDSVQSKLASGVRNGHVWDFRWFAWSSRKQCYEQPLFLCCGLSEEWRCTRTKTTALYHPGELLLPWKGSRKMGAGRILSENPHVPLPQAQWSCCQRFSDALGCCIVPDDGKVHHRKLDDVLGNEFLTEAIDDQFSSRIHRREQPHTPVAEPAAVTVADHQRQRLPPRLWSEVTGSKLDQSEVSKLRDQVTAALDVAFQQQTSSEVADLIDNFVEQLIAHKHLCFPAKDMQESGESIQKVGRAAESFVYDDVLPKFVRSKAMSMWEMLDLSPRSTILNDPLNYRKVFLDAAEEPVILVRWMNGPVECGEPYDFEIQGLSDAWRGTLYVEVKATKHNSARCDFSPAQWSFAKRHGSRYVAMLVNNVFKPTYCRKVEIVVDPVDAVGSDDRIEEGCCFNFPFKPRADEFLGH
jgi:hypothetical protein